MYGLPGRMVGRFTLHHNRTLFLFVFTVDEGPLPTALDLQTEMPRKKYADGAGFSLGDDFRLCAGRRTLESRRTAPGGFHQV